MCIIPQSRCFKPIYSKTVSKSNSKNQSLHIINVYISHWISALRIIWKYLFKSKKKPTSTSKLICHRCLQWAITREIIGADFFTQISRELKLYNTTDHISIMVLLSVFKLYPKRLICHYNYCWHSVHHYSISRFGSLTLCRV